MKKYLDNGKAVWVTQELNPGYLVQDIYESDEYNEEPYPSDYDKQYFVEKVHEKAPTQKYDDEIGELTKEISRLRETKRTMKLRIKEIEKEAETQFEKYKNWPDLKLLDQYVNEKITHYVVLGAYGYSLDIVEFETAICENWTNQLKLLTLFGGSKGNLEWKLNRYSNGSGGDNIVVPCLSYEHAKEELQKYINKVIDINKPRSEFVKCAERFDLSINQDYINKYYQEVKERKRKVIKEHEDSIKNLKKELHNL